MNIGDASKASGVSSKMIRYYEQIGLIKPAHRTDSSYRTYTDNDIHTLRFVRRARDLGFSVEQMKTLLALWRDRSRASADVKAIALEQVAELERKAAAIAEMTKTLKHLVNNCHGDHRPDCPIIEGLEGGRAIRPTGTHPVSQFGAARVQSARRGAARNGRASRPG